MIKSLSLEYPTNGLQKGKNYATMKVEEPPSDNEEWMLSQGLMKFKFLINQIIIFPKSTNDLRITN